MGSADSIRQVAEIIQSAENIVGVVSATSGTTDSLIQLGQAAVQQEEWENELNALIHKHDEILSSLEVEVDLEFYWDNIRKLLQGVAMIVELSTSALDRLMGYGERISSTILAAYLNAQGHQAEAVNAFEIVYTDNTYGEGVVDFEKSNKTVQEKLSKLLGDGITPIVTGFVAQSKEGKYITLGRGGSDYTGAIIAGALDAEELQIWTDVDGILSADPRIVDGAHVLETLSYAEAGELAYFGAKVLHPKTIKPAVKKSIPVRILNTFNPQAPGTQILMQSPNSLKSVTYRKGVCIVNICAAEILEAYGSLAKIFDVFGRYGVVVDVVSTSEVSVSLTVDELPEVVLRELREFAEVEVECEMAIVCLVGNGIQNDTHVLGRLFSHIDEHDVSMVSQGASKRNITFLVRENELKEVVQKVFNTFFAS